MGPDAMILYFWMLTFKQLFSLYSIDPMDYRMPGSPVLHYLHLCSNFTLSLSLRGSLVPLHFLLLEGYHLHIWGCWYFSQKSWFQLVINPVWNFAWCTLLRSQISRVTIYNWCTPFPILNQSVWFLRRQGRWSSITISLRFISSIGLILFPILGIP